MGAVDSDPPLNKSRLGIRDTQTLFYIFDKILEIMSTAELQNSIIQKVLKILNVGIHKS